uniref:Uncharacterized protein n=1 Tax=Mycena chlorophos TaxID=658473 RepID=A0ABQ0M0I7_MYCCL|nr:predicted protein [Mycena chlorophos]
MRAAKSKAWKGTSDRITWSCHTPSISISVSAHWPPSRQSQAPVYRPTHVSDDVDPALSPSAALRTVLRNSKLATNPRSQSLPGHPDNAPAPSDPIQPESTRMSLHESALRRSNSHEQERNNIPACARLPPSCRATRRPTSPSTTPKTYLCLPVRARMSLPENKVLEVAYGRF